MSVLVDTNVLVALVHRSDPLHPRAARVMEELATTDTHGTPLTSDHIVAEGLNFLRRKSREGRVARAFTASVFGMPSVPTPFGGLLRVHGPVFTEALARYHAEWDAGLSLTDWTSLVLMERHGIGAIATFDAGFEPWARVVR